MRGDLQVRQGDTVYVLRDIPIDEKHPDCSDQSEEHPENQPESRDNNNLSVKGKRLERTKKSKPLCDKEKSNGSNKDKNRKGEASDSSNKVSSFDFCIFFLK